MLVIVHSHTSDCGNSSHQGGHQGGGDCSAAGGSGVRHRAPQHRCRVAVHALWGAAAACLLDPAGTHTCMHKIKRSPGNAYVVPSCGANSLGSCVDVLSHAACRPAVQRGSCGLEGRHASWPSHLPHCPVPPSHCTGASIDPSSVSAEEAAETEAGAREKRMRSITSALLDLATGRCAVCCEGVCEGGGTGCGGRGLCAHCWLQWGWF